MIHRNVSETPMRETYEPVLNRKSNKVISLVMVTMLTGSMFWSAFMPIRNADAAIRVNDAAKLSMQNVAKVDTAKREFTLQGISLGITEAQLIKKLGQPARKDTSEYGFQWYIYNKDYKKYMQVGVSKGKVVALYSNAGGWTSKKGIKLGSTRTQVDKAYGKTIKEIKKGNTIFKYNHPKETAVYEVDNTYTTVFFDKHNKNTVSALQIIDKQTELSFKSFHGKPSESLRKSYERQVFDLANVSRVRFGKKPFAWNDGIANTARKHSQDMMKRNFFDHNNPDGESPFDRMEEDGIVYSYAGENIAAGQTSAIFAHEGWMNSIGHRENILADDFTRLGVGISFGGKMQVYYTQNFFTPQS